MKSRFIQFCSPSTLEKYDVYQFLGVAVGITALLVGLYGIVVFAIDLVKQHNAQRQGGDHTFPAGQAPTAKLEILALSSLHLSDWQLLVAKLRLNKVPSDQIRYCQAQIERLQSELTRTNSQAQL